MMTLAVIILFIVLLGLICFKLAMSEVNSDVFTAEPSGDLPVEIAKSVFSGDSYTITEEQLNSYMMFLLNKKNMLPHSDDATLITGLYLDLKQSGPCGCFIRAEKNGRVMYIYSDCDVELTNGQLVFEFSNITLGKLPLPDFAAKQFLKRANLSTAAKYMIPDELEADVPAHFAVDLPEYGELGSIDLETLVIGDDEAEITIKPVITGSASDLFGFFTDKLGDIAGLLQNAG